MIYKYSTVSSIVERVKQEMGRNKILKKHIEELSKNISKSQRKTRPFYFYKNKPTN